MPMFLVLLLIVRGTGGCFGVNPTPGRHDGRARRSRKRTRPMSRYKGPLTLTVFKAVVIEQRGFHRFGLTISVVQGVAVRPEASIGAPDDKVG